MILLFLDTETSGLNPQRHRTLEIAIKGFYLENGAPCLTYESIVQQPASIWELHDPQSLSINGFTWELNLTGKPEREVESEIINDFSRLGIKQGNAFYICQNPSFDRAFFSQIVPPDLQQAYQWPYHWLDFASMYWSRQMREYPQGFEAIRERGLSKDNIAKSLALPPEALPHRAMNGVDHLIACYEALFFPFKSL